MSEFVLTSPLAVKVSRNKSVALNLNVYRNLHYMVSNKSKVVYKQQMREQILKLPVFEKIELEYTLFLKDNRRRDISNVLSIVDKYFCDALTEFQKLPDDDYAHLPKVAYCIGGIDKENPRVEIKIREVQQ